MHDDQPDHLTDDDGPLRRAAEALRLDGPADRALDARLAGFEARVMAAIAAEAPPAAPSEPRDAGPWLLRPHTLRVRPLSALLAVAAAALLAVGLVRPRLPDAPAPAVAAVPDEARSAPDTVRLVQFVLLAPGAHQVALVGDFNHWQGAATPLRRTPAGLWSVELPLAPGRYTYTFVVDGSRFTPDPAAPRALDDDFGTPSSVVTVGAPAGAHT